MPPVDLDIDVHEQTTRLDLPELVRQLIAHLGPTLVATLADVRDRKLPYKWANPEGATPRPESQQKLLAAHRIWAMISGAEGDNVARAWFIGANPRLGEEAPVIRLREGQIKAVLQAAKAFVEGVDD
jgi:hypothetical protein